MSGRQHAGENLADVLDGRPAALPAPIVMSDALNRNVPKNHAVIEANCMSHARRGMVDEVGNYPDACWVVLGSLASIYRLDAQLKQQGASGQQRLLAHQRQSGPILDELHDWMQGALDGKVIEPLPLCARRVLAANAGGGDAWGRGTERAGPGPSLRGYSPTPTATT